MTHVTLMLFSGRRDPAWTLTAGETAELVQLLRDRTSAPAIDSLGYRGFLVESDEPDVPRQFLVRGVREVEEFLLRTAGEAVDDAVIAAVRAQLQ